MPQLVKFIYCVTLTALILSSGVLHAKVITDLNVIVAEVEDQSQSTRNKAISEAFKLVLVRYTGLTPQSLSSTIRENRLTANQYLQRYQYETIDESQLQPSEDETLNLIMIFDEVGIAKLLSQLNLPAWNNNRPELLTWIAVGDKRFRLLLGPDYESQLKTLIRGTGNDPFLDMSSFADQPQPSSNNDTEEETLDPLEQLFLDKVGTDQSLLDVMGMIADERGLPLILPLLDLEDSLTIDSADVWGQFVTQLRLASERYNPDAILAGRVELVADGWLMDWLLLDQSTSEVWQGSAETLSEALSAGLEQSIERIASRFAVVQDTSTSSLIEVSITGINSLSDIAAVEAYLKAQPAISALYPSRVNTTEVRFKLALIGELASLLQSIQLEKRLEETTVSEMQISVNAFDISQPSIYFVWNG